MLEISIIFTFIVIAIQIIIKASDNNKIDLLNKDISDTGFIETRRIEYGNIPPKEYILFDDTNKKIMFASLNMFAKTRSKYLLRKYDYSDIKKIKVIEDDAFVSEKSLANVAGRAVVGGIIGGGIGAIIGATTSKYKNKKVVSLIKINIEINNSSDIEIEIYNSKPIDKESTTYKLMMYQVDDIVDSISKINNNY
jgi:hypothetical protein